MKHKLLFIFLLIAGMASAQNKIGANNLTGTYELVVVDNIAADGSRVHLYGDSPKGILMFDTQGNYTLQIYSEGRPKFAAGDKSKGTDEENRASVKGCNAHYGTYKIEGGNIIFNIQHASFPNWEGTQQKRPFIISGDIFKYIVPAPTTGGAATGEVVWKKLSESEFTEFKN
ncbi:lipocalin-like domain-containing protein [Mucilaginibacter sp. Mucisp86]|uniref:lipocalin-like domain-containing protein n=1 Tax=Mucilaginibacter sp. Mucisp86 TaxID=3243060 RepID=UPI0039B48A52